MRVLLVTGAGGAGKSTIAAATAFRLAERGVKTLLVSMDGTSGLSDVLHVDVPREPHEIGPACWAARVDGSWTRTGATAWIAELLRGTGVDPGAGLPAIAFPGSEQLLGLLALRDLAAGGEWDTVVVDCPPTSETLRLLALPGSLDWYLRRALTTQSRVARGVRPLAALLGRGGPLPSDLLFEVAVRLGDDLSSVSAVLAPPSATVCLVVTPSAAATAAARRAAAELGLYGYVPASVVANRMFPSGASVGAVARRWSAAQRRDVTELREVLGGVDVAEVAYAAEQPVGSSALGTVADDLFGTLPGDDPAGVPRHVQAAADQVQVDRGGSGYLLRIRLALARSEQVTAVRVGDDLLVTVGDRQRPITLPSVLRRCDVRGGRFADGELLVRFEPDPALWPSDPGAA